MSVQLTGLPRAKPGINVTVWCRDGNLCGSGLSKDALLASMALPSEAYLASRPVDWKLPADYINFGSSNSARLAAGTHGLHGSSLMQRG